MITKNSFRQIYRTPVKTALFTLLLAAITAFLCFGINMWLSVAQSLDLADRAFQTIGVVEYRNPDDISGVSVDFDVSPIADSKYVELFDHRFFLAGYSQEIYIPLEINHYKSGHGHSVIVFTPLEIGLKSHFGEDATRLKVLNVLHTTDSRVKAGAELQLRFPDGFYFDFELGKRYICSFLNSNFSISEWIRHYWHYAERPDLSPIMEIAKDNFIDEEDGVYWEHFIKELQESFHTMSVYATNDLNTMLAFHQGNTLIVSGRAFSREDYDKGNRVCLISSAMARRNNLQPGDTISVLFYEQRGLYLTNYGSNVNRIQPSSPLVGQGVYKIIGIYQSTSFSTDSSYDFLNDTVFIPQASINYTPDNDNPYWVRNRDNIISFRLRNGTAEAFLAEMGQYDLPHINLTIFDQGYAKVAGALAEMKDTALILTAICAAAGLGIIILFSLLFVGRQQRNIAIMFALGTSRPKLLGFLLSTVLIVAGLAAAIGGITGNMLSESVLDTVYTQNLEGQAQQAYSSIYGEGVEADFYLDNQGGFTTPLVAAGSVLTLTLVLSSLFAAKILKAEPMQVLTTRED